MKPSRERTAPEQHPAFQGLPIMVKAYIMLGKMAQNKDALEKDRLRYKTAQVELFDVCMSNQERGALAGFATKRSLDIAEINQRVNRNSWHEERQTHDALHRSSNGRMYEGRRDRFKYDLRGNPEEEDERRRQANMQEDAKAMEVNPPYEQLQQ